MQDMIDIYYNGCTPCMIPGGTPLFRLNPTTGAIEELLPDGTFGTPEGDYALPDTPAREEATADERMCAASANAANVLQTLYESLSDSFSESLSYDAAVAAFVAALAGAIGSVFGIIVTPLIVIFALLFGVVYATVEFVTADLWDSEFTSKLVCVLLSCASDDGEVVHFDLHCVLDTLAHGTNIFDPTSSEIRLFGQIYTMLNFLGAQALDAAGATTAITDADCSGCIGCTLWEFLNNADDYASSFTFDGDWTHPYYSVPYSAWFCSTGEQTMTIVIPSGAPITRVVIDYGMVGSGTASLLVNDVVIQTRPDEGNWSFDALVTTDDVVAMQFNSDTGGSNVQAWAMYYAGDINPWPDIPSC